MKPASAEQTVFAEALQLATEARAAYLESTRGVDTALHLNTFNRNENRGASRGPSTVA